MAEPNRPPQLPSHPPAAPPPRQSAIAGCVAALQRDIHSLLLENQRLTSNHHDLKQELSSTHQDLRHLAAISQKIKAESDAELRGVLERSVKVEAELRSVAAIKEELTVVKEVVEKLKVDGEELGDQLRVVNGDVAKAKAKLGVSDLPKIRAEMKSLARDIEKLRAALETERKNRTINLKHGQAKEKKKSSLMEEINRLKHEQTLAKEKRARAAIEEIDRLKDELTLARKERARAAAASVAPNPINNMGSMLMNRPIYMYGSSSMLNGGSTYPVQTPIHQHPQMATTYKMALQEVKAEATLEESNKSNDVRRKDSQGNQGEVKSPPTPPACYMKEVPACYTNRPISIYGSSSMLYGGRSYPVQTPIHQHPQMCLQEVKVGATLEESKKTNDSQDNQGEVKSPPTAPAQSVGTQAKPFHCFNCGDSSHPKKRCDKPPRICHHCGKEGHIIKYCMALQEVKNTNKEKKMLRKLSEENPAQPQQSRVLVGKRKRNQNAAAQGRATEEPHARAT